jgi:hypothetical protein
LRHGAVGATLALAVSFLRAAGAVEKRVLRVLRVANGPGEDERVGGQ